MERETGFEPATSTLARSHSTTELLPPAQTSKIAYHAGGVPSSHADLRGYACQTATETQDRYLEAHRNPQVGRIVSGQAGVERKLQDRGGNHWFPRETKGKHGFKPGLKRIGSRRMLTSLEPLDVGRLEGQEQRGMESCVSQQASGFVTPSSAPSTHAGITIPRQKR